MRPSGLGPFDGELVAGKLLLGTLQQMSNDLETAGIGQGLEDLGDFHAAQFRMLILLHGPD